MSDVRVEEIRTLLPQCMLHDWVRLGRRLARLLRDTHHAEQREALIARLRDEAAASAALREERAARIPHISYPPDLPINARREEIVEAIRRHQVVVIAGETGSGKTTQLPKMCLEAGLGIQAKIGCTQPRRVAALSISRRIAEELNVEWGREVGCKIRFDDHSSEYTFIKMMTDGILLAETQGDPTLSEYNAIIIDEAHERSLNIDFLLGHLKGLLAKRADLNLIVTSATIDTQAFSKHFGDAPIIEVSGRLYPVEVKYKPLDEAGDETSFVDAATQAVEEIVCETNTGDLLIFMPGERDIRETADQIEGRFGAEADVIPLFGRLTAGEQQRVFAPSARRKIVIATNIAETSLTIPGIRFVIDSGLARISRYNPRTRIKRLPIEPVSQSSANQRKGRAGRVEAGVCIRLFSEEDFASRPLFTQPEIQRANLAEVILRMKAFHLGDVETFPFLQPPAPAAIANGYALLQELGALDDRRELTALGNDLARLPIDPTLGRMLLQSQREHAIAEILIIAAGLSIQDPRERPLDQKDAAAAAHRQFTDPQSDFLTLLNIWNAVHDEWDRLRTQSQRRKFCKQRFLSYIRMREWQDVYSQLHDALEDLGALKLNESNAAYDAIHRSVLAGLIGHVARFEDRNSYKMAGNRIASVFPGSALYARGEIHRKQRARGEKPPPASRPGQPEWIVAGEIVETSQLFARTVAGIDPQWIYQLAPHCCKVVHQNPRWTTSAGNVLVDEIVTLHGLEVQRRKVSFGNINPQQATEIFIRSALVEDNLFQTSASNDEDDSEDQDETRVLREAPQSSRELPRSFRFLEHNRRVREKIENWRTRVRHHTLDLDSALAEFYSRHIKNVSSLHEMNRLLGESGMVDRLCVTEAELAGGQATHYDPAAFPDSVIVSGQPVGLAYAYAPGEEHDGVTVKLPNALAEVASSAFLEWSVPGLREEIVNQLLRALPKSIRRELMPFPPKVPEILSDFRPVGTSFLADFAAFLQRRYGTSVKASDWPPDALPSHLRPRFAIHENGATLGVGRDLARLKRSLEKPIAEKIPSVAKLDNAEWLRACEKWENFGVTDWTFGDLPERITVSEGPDLPVYAWPGLDHSEGSVNVRLFRSLDSARAASQHGIERLVELAVQKDLAWLEKDLRALSRLDSSYAPVGDSGELRETAFDHLKKFVLTTAPFAALTRANFDNAVADARKKFPGLATQFTDRLALILELRRQIQQRLGATAAVQRKSFSSLSQLATPQPATPQNPLATELTSLLSSRFLEKVPFEKLPDLARYLKALHVRVERASVNPAKDMERSRQVAPYVTELKKLQSTRPSPARGREITKFRWMVEEFKVSVFAQEVGTAVPISARRLDQQMEIIQQME
jgi:ATP-dependent helicase HrpA